MSEDRKTNFWDFLIATQQNWKGLLAIMFGLAVLAGAMNLHDTVTELVRAIAAIKGAK